MIPISILYTWLLGLFSIGIIGTASYLGYEWQQRSWGWDPVMEQSRFIPSFGWNEETLFFAGALILTFVTLAGGVIVRAILRTKSEARADVGASPFRSPKAASQQRLPRPDGSELYVEHYGPENAPVIVLTHGWGFDSREWNYLKQELCERFHLIVWDEQGLGKSTPPANGDYNLENFASNLNAVLELAGTKPAILLGHSIGGMTILTFCRLFPEALGTRVIGLVLTHTTPTNPVRTTSGSAFFTAIEKPVLVPLMYLTIALSPVVRLMNWLSYWNGSAHLSTKRSSFAGTETWEQIEFATKFQLQASPAVIARGMLGMMRYDASKALHLISVPTLVVAADKDSTTKPEASRQIQSAIPHARLVTLSPAKHLGLIEHHNEYAKVIREFAFSTVAQSSGVTASAS